MSAAASSAEGGPRPAPVVAHPVPEAPLPGEPPPASAAVPASGALPESATWPASSLPPPLEAVVALTAVELADEPAESTACTENW